MFPFFLSVYWTFRLFVLVDPNIRFPLKFSLKLMTIIFVHAFWLIPVRVSKAKLQLLGVFHLQLDFKVCFKLHWPGSVVKPFRRLSCIVCSLSTRL